jgi:hypothetical protein
MSWLRIDSKRSPFSLPTKPLWKMYRPPRMDNQLAFNSSTSSSIHQSCDPIHSLIVTVPCAPTATLCYDAQVAQLRWVKLEPSDHGNTKVVAVVVRLKTTGMVCFVLQGRTGVRLRALMNVRIVRGEAPGRRERRTGCCVISSIWSGLL